MADISKISLGIVNIAVDGKDVGFTSGGAKLTYTYQYDETIYDSFGTIVSVKTVKSVDVQLQFAMLESSAATFANILGASNSGSQLSMDNTVLGKKLPTHTVTVTTAGGVKVNVTSVQIDTLSSAMTSDSALTWVFSLTGKLGLGSTIKIDAF